MNKYLEVAIDTALRTGKYLRFKFKLSKKIEYKGEIDLVTDSDFYAEKKIISLLKKAFPKHEVLAEETADKPSLYIERLDKIGRPHPVDYRWIIDPLDGTTNFAHGYPLFAVSIALEHKGKIILGVVYNPLLKELFTAIPGKGAYLNGKRISVSKEKDLSKCLLATGFPYDIKRNPKTNLDYFGRFQMAARDIRRDGSAALNLCYTACGRFDGFWEMKLKPWDTAAGHLILKEAGGRVTDFSGKKYNIYKKETLASNGKIHQQMLKILR